MPAIIASAALAMIAGPYKAGLAAGAQVITPDRLEHHIQKMEYEVYAGGINAVRAALDVIYEDKEHYSLVLSAATKGFLGKLVPWKGSFETQGWRTEDGGERPELHKSTALWDGEKDIKEYRYNADGSFENLRVIEAGKDKTPATLDDKLVRGTTDVLTASLQAMEAVTENGVCEGESEVFDGKRRFKLVFRHMEEEVLSPTKYNIYKGPAVRCEVEVMPLDGAWHEKPRGWASIQEQGRNKGSLPTVWLARVDDQGPAVPVKMRVKTDYGTLFMHMTSYDNGDTALKVGHN